MEHKLSLAYRLATFTVLCSFVTVYAQTGCTQIDAVWNSCQVSNKSEDGDIGTTKCSISNCTSFNSLIPTICESKLACESLTKRTQSSPLCFDYESIRTEYFIQNLREICSTLLKIVNTEQVCKENINCNIIQNEISHVSKNCSECENCDTNCSITSQTLQCEISVNKTNHKLQLIKTVQKKNGRKCRDCTTNDVWENCETKKIIVYNNKTDKIQCNFENSTNCLPDIERAFCSIDSTCQWSNWSEVIQLPCSYAEATRTKYSTTLLKQDACTTFMTTKQECSFEINCRVIDNGISESDSVCSDCKDCNYKCKTMMTCEINVEDKSGRYLFSIKARKDEQKRQDKICAEWGKWNSRTCNNNKKIWYRDRQRTCQFPPYILNRLLCTRYENQHFYCPDGFAEENECNWGMWTECSSSCGDGVHKRNRYSCAFPLSSGSPCNMAAKYDNKTCQRVVG